MQEAGRAIAAVALLAVALAGQQPPAATMPATSPPQQPAVNACEPFQGALSVRIHPLGTHLKPAAELLLTDPKGRRTGMDPAARKSYQEIPNSGYELEGIDDDETGEPGPASGMVDIWCAPEEGAYRLEVIGTVRGQYELEIAGFDLNLEAAKQMVGPVWIKPGVRHGYAFEYSRQPGATLEVRRLPPTRPKTK